MPDSVNAYRKHKFIQKSIDLIATGVAWGGGGFHALEGDIDGSVAQALSDYALVDLARGLLLFGGVRIGVAPAPGGVKVAIFEGAQAPGTSVVNILRSDRGDDAEGEPVLAHALGAIDMYETLLGNLRTNQSPDLVDLLAYLQQSIHSALSIPGCMLEQPQIDQTNVIMLKQGAILFQSEVNLLRQNVRYGLNHVAHAMQDALHCGAIQWRWNAEWMTSRPCEFGWVYQVFRSQGLILEPIRRDEVGALQLAHTHGFVSKRTVDECAASYGVA